MYIHWMSYTYFHEGQMFMKTELQDSFNAESLSTHVHVFHGYPINSVHVIDTWIIVTSFYYFTI